MLLVCDLDGTLIDSFADIRRGIEHALAEIGVPATESILALCRLGIGLEAFYEQACGRPAVGAEFDRFVAAYRTFYRQTARGTAFPHVADGLAAIRRRLPGVRCAVATTKRTDIARHVIQAAGLGGYFDLVRGSDDLPHKPDPAILHDVAATLGVDLAGAIVVGDTDRDMLAARAAGCVSVAVTWGGWTRDELAALWPDHMIDRFDELVDIAVARLG